jgi:NAD(P)-dependent dehydrogenase (short-subunit alcohol dehydrogenase family)
MDLGLSGKNAICGSKGIGLALCRVAWQEGCRVAITSRDKANLHAAANRIKGFSFMLRI